jgi:hypothetical protein
MASLINWLQTFFAPGGRGEEEIIKVWFPETAFFVQG